MAAEETEKKSGGGGFIVALVVLTLLGAGLGVGFGMFVIGDAIHGGAKAAAQKTAGKDGKGKKKTGKKKKGKYAKKDKDAKKKKGKDAKGEEKEKKSEKIKAASRVIDLPPILTNLRQSDQSWIRLELKALTSADDIPDETALMQMISQDILSYLRSTRVRDLDSASGFLLLRSDLNEIARARSQGKVAELFIQGLIVE